MSLDKLQPAQTIETVDIEKKFAESKVRDPETGRLLVLRHFSDAPDIKKFSLDRPPTFGGDQGFFGAGIYFTGIDGSAEEYGDYRYDVNLNLKNPLIIRNATMEDVNRLNGKREEIITQGYDGVMVWSDEKPAQHIVDESMTIKQAYRPAGWSEICVFNPDDIHIIEVNKK